MFLQMKLKLLLKFISEDLLCHDMHGWSCVELSTLVFSNANINNLKCLAFIFSKDQKFGKQQT